MARAAMRDQIGYRPHLIEPRRFEISSLEMPKVGTDPVQAIRALSAHIATVCTHDADDPRRPHEAHIMRSDGIVSAAAGIAGLSASRQRAGGDDVRARRDGLCVFLRLAMVSLRFVAAAQKMAAAPGMSGGPPPACRCLRDRI